METLTFKTNIKCGGCVATVLPFFDQEESIRYWKVDTSSPDRVLTVRGHNIDPQQVENLVQQAGFRAEVMRITPAEDNNVICRR